MYFSRVRVHLNRLPPVMRAKVIAAGDYAWHQWLWQLFPEQSQERMLFRRDDTRSINTFYVVSASAPSGTHELFSVETKLYHPSLLKGATLLFSLRANPVITRQKKRYDVLMDAKCQAKKNAIPKDGIWNMQEQAAKEWLIAQGKRHGFSLEEYGDECRVMSYQQHRLQKRVELAPIQFSSVDYEGRLTVTDPELFSAALVSGLGKSKGFGCGLLLVKKG